MHVSRGFDGCKASLVDCASTGEKYVDSGYEKSVGEMAGPIRIAHYGKNAGNALCLGRFRGGGWVVCLQPGDGHPGNGVPIIPKAKDHTYLWPLLFGVQGVSQHHRKGVVVSRSNGPTAPAYFIMVLTAVSALHSTGMRPPGRPPSPNGDVKKLHSRSFFFASP